jgi:hypothetical protein
VRPEHGETIADEATDAHDTVEPSTPEPTLLLQKTENRLIRHHETSDPRMIPILDALLEDNGIAAIVDGGAASNVI